MSKVKSIPEQVLNHLASMGVNTLDNYVIGGLSSTKVEKGLVRIFSMNINQRNAIMPHNHRYDLACLVLQGSVRNTIYVETEDPKGELLAKTILTYRGEVGEYDKEECSHSRYSSVANTYGEGDWYFMNADDIHDITFSKGAIVLVFEGESRYNVSVMLEPVDHNDRVIPLGETQEWMFVNRG